MITDLLAGVLLGIALTLAVTGLLVFYARRKCWVDIRITPAPNSHTDMPDHLALGVLTERLDDLRGDFDHLEGLLAPYLDRKREE